MSPTVLNDHITRFQDMVGGPIRVGVSEFARSKSWRAELPEVGCFEIVDRNGVVGYMIAPDYAVSLANRIAELEQQLEQESIAAMFSTRSDRSETKTSSELETHALDYFDQNFSVLAGALHGN